MRASVTEKPQVTLHSVADAESLMDVAKSRGMTPTPLIVRAVARALIDHPDINRWLVDGMVIDPGRVDVGVAVDTPRGLMVPVVRDASSMSIAEIGEALTLLAGRANAGEIGVEELSDATFSVTSLGSMGVRHFTPIVNPPQVAILGVGTLEPMPVVVGNSVQVLRLAHLSLTFDHAAIDGAPAARFLKTLTELISSRATYDDTDTSEGGKDV